MDSETIKEGFLDKKLKIQGFQSRYFVLKKKTLFYYKNETDAKSLPDKPLGVIPLKNAILEAPHGRSAQRNAFRLSFKDAKVKKRLTLRKTSEASVDEDSSQQVVKQAKYVLSAATLEDKVEWEELVREQIWNASTTDEDQEKKERRLSGLEKPELYKPMNIQACIEEEEEDELDEEDDD